MSSLYKSKKKTCLNAVSIYSVLVYGRGSSKSFPRLSFAVDIVILIKTSKNVDRKIMQPIKITNKKEQKPIQPVQTIIFKNDINKTDSDSD